MEKNQSQNFTVAHILPNGDCALLLRFTEIEAQLACIHALAADFLAKPLPDLINVIPAVDSLVLVFSQPVNHALNWFELVQLRCDQLLIEDREETSHEIPVCYDATLASDLLPVCESLNITRAHLIKLHTEPIYQVAMLGFLPGFAYLNGNDVALSIPRKSTPVLAVPAGSVAMAAQQTGVYSLSSPGGWHVIGRTPLRLLDWNNTDKTMRLSPLDRVKFKAISLSEFNALNQST